MTVRYAVVGTGYFGAEQARFLNELEDAEIVAVYDPHNAEGLAKEVGAEVGASIEDVVNRPDVDAVIVASPNGAHREPVLAAAAAGKHVFCEKPIALSYDDCREMIDATEAAGVAFMAGHVMNFMAGIRQSKRIIAEGRIGDVLFIRALRNGWEDAQKEVSWKKMRELSGGHLYHHIHELDFVQSVMGPAQTATMVGGNVAHQGENFGDEDDMLLITLEFPGKRFACLEYGSAFRWPEHYVLIQGSKGAIKIDLQDVGVTLKVGAAEEKFLLHRSPEEDLDRTRIYAGSATDGAVQYGNPERRPPLWLRGIIEEELTYFHGLMKGDEPTDEFRALSDGSAATAAIATADACTISLNENRKVAISEVTG